MGAQEVADKISSYLEREVQHLSDSDYLEVLDIIEGHCQIASGARREELQGDD